MKNIFLILFAVFTNSLIAKPYFVWPVGPDNCKPKHKNDPCLKNFDNREIGSLNKFKISQYYKENGHLGIDINSRFLHGNNDKGIPVFAASHGKAILVKDLGFGKAHGWGKVIMIKHIAHISSRGFLINKTSNKWVREVNSMYAHLNNVFIKTGDMVFAGQLIGTIGDGNGYYQSCKYPKYACAHLHYEIREDIKLPIDDGRNGYSKNTNGYINPLLFTYYNQSSFSDVKGNDWFIDYVEYLKSKNIIHGEEKKDPKTGKLVPSGKFNPYRFATRAEAVKILLRGSGKTVQPMSKVYNGKFKDVPKTHHLAAEIYTALKLNLFPYVNPQYFKPDDKILRKTSMEWTVKFFKLLKPNTSKICSGNKCLDSFSKLDLRNYFTDARNKGTAINAFKILYFSGNTYHGKNGILGGYPDKTIKLNNPISRAELAKLTTKTIWFLRGK